MAFGLCWFSSVGAYGRQGAILSLSIPLSTRLKPFLLLIMMWECFLWLVGLIRLNGRCLRLSRTWKLVGPCLMLLLLKSMWMLVGVESSHLRFVSLVAWDSIWKFLAASRRAIEVLCVSQAEALAFLLNCELGISQGFTCIFLESNSLELVSCLNGKLEDGS